MGAIESHHVYGIQIRESANDGSDFTNPDADYRLAFLGEDGKWHVKDSAGTVTSPFDGAGAVATDAIWDASGDLAVGTGANTAAKLTLGATGTYPKSNGTTLAYSLPPGHEYNHTEKTSDTSITATAEGSANTIVTASGGIALDGSTPVIVEFFSDEVTVPATASNNFVVIYLYDDTGGGAASIGAMGLLLAENSAHLRASQLMRRRITPSSATHTYSVRAIVGSGTGTVGAGAGGNGNRAPAYIRVTKAS